MSHLAVSKQRWYCKEGTASKNLQGGCCKDGAMFSRELCGRKWKQLHTARAVKKFLTLLQLAGFIRKRVSSFLRQTYNFQLEQWFQMSNSTQATGTPCTSCDFVGTLCVFPLYLFVHFWRHLSCGRVCPHACFVCSRFS